ncbi:AfsR/SARP family transcriptional regulator, partial [Variovorax sp. WDL1]
MQRWRGIGVRKRRIAAPSPLLSRKDVVRGLRILLLGRPRLELDGQPLTRLIALKHQALVYYLAVKGGPVPRAELATLLWETLDEAAARANLRVALTRLRRWLPELLDIDAHQVGFAPGAPLAIDLCELHAALDPSMPHDARVAAARAWRGPLLDGMTLDDADGFERWLAATRQRALRDVVALRHALAAHARGAGRSDEALAHLRALLEIDDADEPAHMALMELLGAAGQRTAALAQYEACRAALAERLGARPSAACYGLYVQIHADAPALVAPDMPRHDVPPVRVPA